MDAEKIKQGVRLLLEGMGEDPAREGLVETPDRIARMYEELCAGYGEDAGEHLGVRFRVEESGIVLEKDIRFYSMCEHHLLPFYGTAAVAYIPQGEVVGLSKIARTVEVYAKRLQLQERMTAQIADAFMEKLAPKGVMVFVEAEHMCMTMRGIKKPGSKTVTTAARGVFETDGALREAFWHMLGRCALRIGNREFDTENGVYVMGILNVTPDSFSDGGRWLERDAALRQAAKMAAEGAAIIDIGGESTRPGHRPVGAEEEAARVLPVIAAVKRETGLPVSVDTYRHETARLALEAGADMINDIWGLRYDGGEMARLIAQSGAACCLMHNRKSAEYRDFMPELLEDLRGTLDLAAAAGIARERIILDPGIGFAKSCEQNLTAMHRLDELAALGCPVLLAASRKSVVGLSLGLPVEERLEGTLATTAIGVLRGAAFVRVHDVKENLRAARMALAIRREARPGEGA